MAKRELDQVTDGECQPAAVRRPTASILHFAASWIPSRRFSCHHLKYQTRIMFPLFHPGDRFRLTFDRLVRSCPCAEPENWTQIPSRKYRQQMASRRSLKKGCRCPLCPLIAGQIRAVGIQRSNRIAVAPAGISSAAGFDAAAIVSSISTCTAVT